MYMRSKRVAGEKVEPLKDKGGNICVRSQWKRTRLLLSNSRRRRTDCWGDQKGCVHVLGHVSNMSLLCLEKHLRWISHQVLMGSI